MIPHVLGTLTCHVSGALTCHVLGNMKGEDTGDMTGKGTGDMIELLTYSMTGRSSSPPLPTVSRIGNV